MEREKFICKYCGQAFERKSGNQDFCSKECRYKNSTQQAKVENENKKTRKKKDNLASYNEYCKKYGYINYGMWQLSKKERKIN